MLALVPSLLSAAATAIASAVSTYGPVIAKYGSQLLTTVGKHLPVVMNAIESIADVVGIGGADAQELGAKAALSEKKPEDFDSFNDYINHLKTEVTLKSGDMADNGVGKITQQAAGAAILLTGIGNNLDAKVSLPLLCKATLAGVAPPVVTEMIKAYDQHGISGDDFGKYIENALPLADAEKHSHVLIEAFQAANPSMTLEQAEDAIMALR